MVYEQSEEAQLEAAIRASLDTGDDQHSVLVVSDSDDSDDHNGECHVTSSNTRNPGAGPSKVVSDCAMETRSRTRRGAAQGIKNEYGESSHAGNCADLCDNAGIVHTHPTCSGSSSRDKESIALPAGDKQATHGKRKMPARRSKRKRRKMSLEDPDGELATDLPKCSPPRLETLSSTTTATIGSSSGPTFDGSTQRLGRDMPVMSTGARSSRLSHQQAMEGRGHQQAMEGHGHQRVEEVHLLIRLPDGERIARTFPSNGAIEVCEILLS